MANNKSGNILEEVIKQTLSNYEVPYTTSDWSQMERILDAAPKSNSFKYKRKLVSVGESVKAIPKARAAKWLFSPYFLIGLLIVCGSFFVYRIFYSNKTVENNVNSIPQDTIEKTIPIVVATETVKTIIPPTISVDTLKSKNDSVESTEIVPDKKEDIVQKETILPEKKENIKPDIKKDLKKEDQILKKKNQSILVEVHDSLKELNKKQPDNTFGRNNFLLQSINADSIRKHQNPAPKDSLK